MRAFSILLCCGILSGCNAIGPMPGHLTQNVTNDQMTMQLDKHLKPGMPLDEAQKFLKNEEFAYGYAQTTGTGVETIKFTRRDPIDFWNEQAWTVTLEGSQGKLVRYLVKGEAEGTRK